MAHIGQKFGLGAVGLGGSFLGTAQFVNIKRNHEKSNHCAIGVVGYVVHLPKPHIFDIAAVRVARLKMLRFTTQGGLHPRQTDFVAAWAKHIA